MQWALVTGITSGNKNYYDVMKTHCQEQQTSEWLIFHSLTLTASLSAMLQELRRGN